MANTFGVFFSLSFAEEAVRNALKYEPTNQTLRLLLPLLQQEANRAEAAFREYWSAQLLEPTMA